MADIRWVKNHIEIDPPKHPKKLTGTRFASVLGKNTWSTPFQTWCAITRTWEEPFEDTKYTLAGKAIEPKQIRYVADHYLLDVLTPTDKYGADYFDKTRGDFFAQVSDIYGGMWDALSMDGEWVDAVLEMKTTKRAEDWAHGAPEYYALQAALYAWLIGTDKVIMVCSFLTDNDYDHTDTYACTPRNTILDEFRVSERFPDFQNLLNETGKWWHEHVLTGISPEFDEVRDKEALAALRKVSLSPDTDVDEMFSELDVLQREIDAENARNAPLEKRYKELTSLAKEYMLGAMKDSDTKAEVKSANYVWVVSKATSTSIDKEALKRDGLLEKYQTVSETARLTKKAR